MRRVLGSLCVDNPARPPSDVDNRASRSAANAIRAWGTPNEKRAGSGGERRPLEGPNRET